MITLESPITGEVVEVNDALLDNPGLASKGLAPGSGLEGGAGDGWIARVDPLLSSGDPDPDFTAMRSLLAGDSRGPE